MISVTKEQLLEYFTYNEVEGEFYLKNKLVGSIDKQGYIKLKYNNIDYRLNKLIYFIHNDYYPSSDEYIIHINGNRSDTRIENLKLVDKDNNIEIDKTGVYYYNRLNKYAAFIDRGKVRSLIDYFDSVEEANIAVDKSSSTKNNNAIDMPEQKYLEECIDYNLEDGLAYWRIRPLHHFGSVGKQNNFNSRYSGNLINSKDDKNYIIVGIDKKYYKLHRIIWKLVYGEEPKYFIDHINGDASDNRIENLRDLDNTFNQRNHNKLSTNNTSGYIGVSPSKDKWLATIKKDRETIRVGLYDNVDEAAYARELKMLDLYGKEFYHSNENKKILLEELENKLSSTKIAEIKFDMYKTKIDNSVNGYFDIQIENNKYYAKIIFNKYFIETDRYNTLEELYENILIKKTELSLLQS